MLKPLIVTSFWLNGVLGALEKEGAKGYIVGGAVRDAVLGRMPLDLDVEVYGISYEKLDGVLSRFGQTDVVGREFGVIKCRTESGRMYDFSLPRRESNNGVGHRDFLVAFDPDITPEKAAARRDFTVNAMLYDPLTDELLDFYDGQDHLLYHQLLCPTSKAFKEDALRVLRAFQLSARLEMEPSPLTCRFAREMMDGYSALSVERISAEWMKWATKGVHLRLSLLGLEKMGWLELYPQLAALVGSPQDPRHHPEGDVFTHTGYVCDMAAAIADDHGLEGDDRAVLIFAALCHDMGKPATTKIVPDGKRGGTKTIHYGHEHVGAKLSREFLQSIGIKEDIIKRVVPLVRHHLAHMSAETSASAKMVRKLAENLAPATIEELCWLMRADCAGRPPVLASTPEGVRNILATARDEKAMKGPQRPIIQGRHLIERGMEPSPAIGVWVKKAREAQLNGEFSTEEEAMAWLDAALKGGG